MTRLKPLDAQVVVVVGASSGIGLVTARMAAKRGAKVVLVARNGAALADIAAGIVAAGGEAAYAIADVGKLDEVRATAAAALARFGRIDSWVHCAGVAIYAPLIETPEDEHQRLFQTNYFGVVHGAQVAVEHLRRDGGALIVVGSIASDIPSPVMGAYAASKHAVKGYVDSLRIEVNAAALPISVTLVKPSGISTPIAEHAANHQWGEARIPPPAYDPDLVAQAILDAAVHPRRVVTVGGIGRLQVLAGTHFPGMLARFGWLIAPLLVARDRPSTDIDNLARPMHDAAERSGDEPGRRFSLYGAGRLPRLLALGAGIAMAAAAARAASRSRRS